MSEPAEPAMEMRAGLLSRLLREPEQQTLYHYTSTATLHAIIRGRQIWLSSLSLSNDSKEGRLIADVMETLATTDKWAAAEIAEVQRAVEFMADLMDGLGFCLSEEGDLLSQWRGYADDGCGVSIGFSRLYLESLANSMRTAARNAVGIDGGLELQKVIYDFEQQKTLLAPSYAKISDVIEASRKMDRAETASVLAGGSLEERSASTAAIQDAALEVQRTVARSYANMYVLKGKAFKEEKEWRLLSYKFDEEPCDCRPARDKLVPYRAVRLADLGVTPIQRIVLGPKNQTPLSALTSFLKRHGFDGVEVVRSSASYR